MQTSMPGFTCSCVLFFPLRDISKRLLNPVKLLMDQQSNFTNVQFANPINLLMFTAVWVRSALQEHGGPESLVQPM